MLVFGYFSFQFVWHSVSILGIHAGVVKQSIKFKIRHFNVKQKVLFLSNNVNKVCTGCI